MDHGDEAPALAKISRSADILEKFFAKYYPNLPVAKKVGDLTQDQHKKYRSFVRQLNPEPYKACEQAYDAARRDERAEAQRNRRQEDPGHVREIEKRWRESDDGKVVQFLKDTRTWALRKQIPFEITKEDVVAISKNPCFYCGETNNDYCVDAVDVATGFVQGNIQPSCQPCNRFKKDHHFNDFVRIMCNIGATHAFSAEIQWTPDYDFVNPNKDLKSGPFQQYVQTAASLGRDFELTKAEFETLSETPCYYCGLLRADTKNGVDRVDSAKGYVGGNVVACCGPCNVMKSNFAQSLFMDKAARILRNWGPRINSYAGSPGASTAN